MATRREFIQTSLAIAAATTLPARTTRSAIRPRFTSNPFTLGVASGYPTPGSVILWTRLAPSPLEPGGGMTQPVVPVLWEVATDDKMKSVVRSGTSYATADWAHSVHAEAAGLEAGRW
jgi:alkaline phosphatase D